MTGGNGGDRLDGGSGDYDSLHGNDDMDFLVGGLGAHDYCDSGPPVGDGNDSTQCEEGPDV